MLHGVLRAAQAALAALLLLYAVYLAVTGNFNLGNLLVWVLAVGFCLYLGFRRPLNRWLTGTAPGRAVLALLVLGAVVYAALLVFVAVSGRANPADGSEQAVIVLGAGLRRDVPSRLLRCRLDAAYDYAAAHPGVLVVTTGGQGRGETLPEGEAMRDYLVAKGLDPQRVITENRSTSTEENFTFARELMQAQGLDTSVPVVYVTNAFHCYRAGRYAAMAGFAGARALPAATPLSALLPCYLREVLAVLYYWVFRRVDGGPLQGAVGLMALSKRYFYR